MHSSSATTEVREEGICGGWETPSPLEGLRSTELQTLIIRR